VALGGGESGTKMEIDYVDYTAISTITRTSSGAGSTPTEAIKDVKHRARMELLLLQLEEPPVVTISSKDKPVPKNHELKSTTQGGIPPNGSDGLTWGTPTVTGPHAGANGEDVYYAFISLTIQAGASTRVTYHYGKKE
jgi:hypothetical protein